MISLFSNIQANLAHTKKNTSRKRTNQNRTKKLPWKAPRRGSTVFFVIQLYALRKTASTRTRKKIVKTNWTKSPSIEWVSERERKQHSVSQKKKLTTNEKKIRWRRLPSVTVTLIIGRSAARSRTKTWLRWLFLESREQEIKCRLVEQQPLVPTLEFRIKGHDLFDELEPMGFG